MVTPALLLPSLAAVCAECCVQTVTMEVKAHGLWDCIWVRWILAWALAFCWYSSYSWFGNSAGKPNILTKVIPIVCNDGCQAWEGPGVVASARKLIGVTNPLQAEPGTIRGDFAIEVGRWVMCLFHYCILLYCIRLLVTKLFHDLDDLFDLGFDDAILQERCSREWQSWEWGAWNWWACQHSHWYTVI